MVYRVVWTYLLSSLWHGIEPGFYVTFGTLAIMTIAARKVSHHKSLFYFTGATVVTDPEQMIMKFEYLLCFCSVSFSSVLCSWYLRWYLQHQIRKEYSSSEVFPFDDLCHIKSLESIQFALSVWETESRDRKNICCPQKTDGRDWKQKMDPSKRRMLGREYSIITQKNFISWCWHWEYHRQNRAERCRTGQSKYPASEYRIRTICNQY